MKKLHYTLLVTFVLSSFAAVQAGGWLQGKDKAYFKLNQSAIRGDQFYNGLGEQVKITTTGVYSTSIYGEYGISNKFDAIGYLPFITRLTLNDIRFSSGRLQEGDELTAIGDAQLGLKYGIRQGKPLVISASLILGLPLGNSSGGNTGLLQSGDGEFNQMVMFDVGYGFKIPLYANIGIGFNNRTEGFSEEFRLNAELGYTYKKKLNVAFKLAMVESFMNGDPEGSAGNGIFSNNIEYVSFGPELSYQFSKKFGVTTSYATASSGQFILAEPSYGFGVFMKID